MPVSIDPRFARRGLILVFVALLLDIVGIAMVAPILPQFLTMLTHDSIGEASVDGGAIDDRLCCDAVYLCSAYR